jgi:hypothetical protein
MKVLILGNGFNLDLGLDTRYSDFAESQQWKELYEKFKHTHKDNLAGFLKKKADESNWFAIEECLKEYAQRKILEKDFVHVIDDKWFLELLENHLEIYLNSVSMDAKEEIHLAKILINMMNKKHIFDKVYTFNYISHAALHKWFGCNYESDVCHVHQRLYCGIVLGVAEKDITDNRYSFLRKVNHKSYPSTNLGNDLMEADEVVIFGHSLNTIDFDYFREFFIACSQYNETKVRPTHITIIDKSDDSIQNIKNNLTSNGISVTALCKFSHTIFIALDNYYRGDYTERDNVRSLMERLKANDA